MNKNLFVNFFFTMSGEQHPLIEDFRDDDGMLIEAHHLLDKLKVATMKKGAGRPKKTATVKKNPTLSVKKVDPSNIRVIESNIGIDWIVDKHPELAVSITITKGMSSGKHPKYCDSVTMWKLGMGQECKKRICLSKLRMATVEDVANPGVLGILCEHSLRHHPEIQNNPNVNIVEPEESEEPEEPEENIKVIKPKKRAEVESER